MKAIGVNSIITKFSAVNSQHADNLDPSARYPAFYATSLPWLEQKVDSVGPLLAAADARNFSVHLGHWQDAAWFNASNHQEQFLDLLAERSLAVCAELHAIYGHHKSLRGIYDPNEPKASDWWHSQSETDAVVDRYFRPSMVLAAGTRT